MISNPAILSGIGELMMSEIGKKGAFDALDRLYEENEESLQKLAEIEKKEFYRFFAVSDYSTGEGLTYFLQISRNYEGFTNDDEQLKDFKEFIKDEYYHSSIEELQEEEFMKTYANLIPPHVVKMVERKDQPSLLWQTHFHVNYS